MKTKVIFKKIREYAKLLDRLKDIEHDFCITPPYNGTPDQILIRAAFEEMKETARGGIMYGPDDASVEFCRNVVDRLKGKGNEANAQAFRKRQDAMIALRDEFERMQYVTKRCRPIEHLLRK